MLLVLASGVLTGCATLYDKVSTSELAFVSEPEGAVIEMAKGGSCTAPCKLAVDKAEEQSISAKLDGKTLDQRIYLRISYTFWTNFVFGVYGVLGLGVDWYTGSMWTYSVPVVRFDFSQDRGTDDDDDDDEEGATRATPEGIPVPDTTGAHEAGTSTGQGRSGEPQLLPEEQPPPPSQALTAVRSEIPETYLAQEVRYYYGGMPPAEAQKVENRLWHLLLKMQADGERPDVDEAVRRDRFAHLRSAPQGP